MHAEIWPRARLAAPLFFIALLCGCDGLLDVKDPDIVTPENLETEEGLATLRAGVLGDLAKALSGNASGHGATPGVILYSGLLSGEYIHSGSFGLRQEVDQRNVRDQNPNMSLAYSDLHRARASAESAAEALSEFSSLAADPRIAEMKNIEGITYVMFGEHYCSGVPFSTAPKTGDLVFGQPQSTAEIFQSAIQRFDDALGDPGGSATQESFARVGKGRALVNLGLFSEAGTVVASVPTDFVYEIEHSSNSVVQENGIFALTTIRHQWSITDMEGQVGLPYLSVDDPRVLWDFTPGDVGEDGFTPYFNQLKYPTASAPVVLADGIEARLIEAEAALAGGNLSNFQTIHNDLRSRVGLGPIDVTGMSQSEVVDFHFQERAFWLFTTGHRVGDMRRLVRQYGRDSESVFPTGDYFRGGQYGPDVNFIIPIEERNNPNFTGCLDRGA